MDIQQTKTMLSGEIDTYLRKNKITKTSLAKQLGTSRAQLNRFMNSNDLGFTTTTLFRICNLLGKKVVISFEDKE